MEPTANIGADLVGDFEAVLRHCALKGAQRVTYSQEITAEGSQASLKYYDGANKPIGDDRDYDILKSCFMRLERLFQTLAERLIEEPASNTDIRIVKLRIDLDLVSGQMTVELG